MRQAVVRTDLPLANRREGKVRDVYFLENDRIAIVATDRISAFDIVLPTPIPGKGRLLTDISARWMRWIEDEGLCRTFLESTDPADLPGITPEERRTIEGRVTIGRRCDVVPVECVARGYLAGSGWVEYRERSSVCGVDLSGGLLQGEKLPAPIFTPATKAERGAHDENIPFERACELAGRAVMERLRDLTLAIYEAAASYASERGLLLADTKFEFGVPQGERPDPDRLILVDEALTPDSSRYWPAEDWRPGREQLSFDKQFVREHLLALVAKGAWDKTAPGPELPEAVVEATLARYEEARRRLFG